MVLFLVELPLHEVTVFNSKQSLDLKQTQLVPMQFCLIFLRNIQQLLSIARQVAPHAADFSSQDIAPWHGFRAMTPDSQPITRNVPGTSVFTNVGHGMLGWTLAAVTSDYLTDLITSPVSAMQTATPGR